MRRKNAAWPLLGVAAGAAAAIAYLRVIRPWMQSWGTEPDECHLTYQGEGLVPRPRIDATLAVTINAPPPQVWPWLVQLGQDKGGFYSYDFLENLAGLNIHTADGIVPEWQGLKVGDRVMLAEDFGIPVAALEPERALVLHGDTRMDDGSSAPPVRPGDYLAVMWGFYLLDAGEERTRLVSRWKADWNPGPVNFLAYHVLLEPVAFLMLRRMLIGIKERAEAV